MKKLVFAVAVCAFLVSCKKIAAGGNQGVIVLEDGVERYDTHESRTSEQKSSPVVVDTVTVAPAVKDSAAVVPAQVAP